MRATGGGARSVWLWHAGGALSAVLALAAISLVGAGLLGLQTPFALTLPALALATFWVGVTLRVGRWMRAPVPFRIPITTGQQASLRGLRRSRLGAPRSAAEAWARGVVDLVLFRPLLRTAPTIPAGCPPVGGGRLPWLWLFAVVFHGSLLVVLLRHACRLLGPFPGPLGWLTELDAGLEVGHPRWHLTGGLLLVGVGALLARRLFLARLRYISLFADYFPLFLLAALGTSGLWLRHAAGVDLVAVRALLRGAANLSLTVPPGLDAPFLLHLFLACALVAYFPSSKLMHLPGALMSPTLTMANSGRAKRHPNPWNPPVEVRSYADYEEEFRERMLEAGLPVTEE